MTMTTPLDEHVDRPGTVLVTGGSSGLGAAVVEAVAKAGGRPLVLDIHEPTGGSAVDHGIVDLGDARAAEAAVRDVVQRSGGVLDGVVTSAGTDKCGVLSEVDG